jgi:hypothetical protein
MKTKTIMLCGITLLTVAPAFAQAPATANRANNIVTMTGCVGSSADSSGFTLGNAMVIPGTAQPGQTDQTPPQLPPTVTSPSAQPPAAAPMPPATSAAAPPPASAAAAPTQVSPPASTAQVPPRASAAQVPAPATGAQLPPTSAGTPGAAGTSGTTPTSVTGTTGVVAAGATPNTASGLGGYRLSGVDMTSWAGQRVQVMGTFSPSAATAAGTTATGASGAPAAPPLEFRVQSVQPMSGPCPK